MNPYLETMQLLQHRLRAGATADTDALRRRVPAPVLAHFDRMIAQGRKGVAEVSHGVCGACHLRLPVVVVVPSAEHADLQLCDNCGAYLIFPTEETATEAPVIKPRRRRAVAMA